MSRDFLDGLIIGQLVGGGVGATVAALSGHVYATLAFVGMVMLALVALRLLFMKDS